jgi:hypothetical protein
MAVRSGKMDYIMFTIRILRFFRVVQVFKAALTLKENYTKRKKLQKMKEMKEKAKKRKSSLSPSPSLFMKQKSLTNDFNENNGFTLAIKRNNYLNIENTSTIRKI